MQSQKQPSSSDQSDEIAFTKALVLNVLIYKSPATNQYRVYPKGSLPGRGYYEIDTLERTFDTPGGALDHYLKWTRKKGR